MTLFRNTSTSKRGFTLIELLVVLAIIGILIAIFLPARRTAGSAARTSQCFNNLHNIALALHSYESDHQVFPPAYTVDADGKPLHSWRTLILPYLDQKSLYDRIDLSKAWNDPVNAEAFQSTISTYHCPASKSGTNQTTYLAVLTPHSCLRPSASCSIKDIADGLSNTILVIEVDAEQAVPWMAPTDADEALLLSFGPKSRLLHNGGWHTAFGDGSVKWLNAKMSAADRRALVSVAGNDKVSEEP